MQWIIKSNVNETANDREQAIVDAVLSNRDLRTREAIDRFLNPPSPLDIDPSDTGINADDLKAAIRIITQAIADHQPILIYGDYDADGVTATAILWETLTHMGAKAFPFIPSRENHGYGLSIKGLEDALLLTPETVPLIITVDNGIVANQAVEWINDKGIPIIITDHHQIGDEKPHANAIVHTTSLCGAGVAWMIAKTLQPENAPNTLDLACIGTISDMMPLTNTNRSLVKYGLVALQQSQRPGIKALLAEAGISPDETITPYHVNYVIAPRLNAMGRMEHALDSLRLLCTKNSTRASTLANTLGSTNHNRQDLTQELLDRAKNLLFNFEMSQKIIVLDDDQFHEGVIGLVAGKLAEIYYRPTIIISRKPGISKASARSINGVNITELIRQQSDLLEGVGGHPMAAGFSIRTEKIEHFKNALIFTASQIISETMLKPTLTLDVEVDFTDITKSLYEALQQLQPFGIGNSQPTFAIQGVVISTQALGKEGKHLKINFAGKPGQSTIPIIWFGHGSEISAFPAGSPIRIAATLNLNSWRGRTTLQLIAKDIVLAD